MKVVRVKCGKRGREAFKTTYGIVVLHSIVGTTYALSQRVSLLPYYHRADSARKNRTRDSVPDNVTTTHSRK